MPNKSEMKLVNAVFELNLNEMRPLDVNGRACYRVEAKTLPDDICMNGVKYPADEIAKGYRTLNNKPAPLGHPKVDGWYVSGSDPEGINRNWCGAWNANVQRVLEGNGKYRVHHSIYIDIETAKQSDNGRRVLAAFEKGDVIHTSTGVLCNAEYAGKENEGYEWIARNIELDHNAILLDEQGAATPNDGVGVFVNQSVDENKHLTINSFRYKENNINDSPSGESPKNNTEGDLPMSDKPAENKPETGNNKPAEVTAVTTNGNPGDTITVSQSELAKMIGDVMDAKFNERDERNAASEKAELVSKVVAVNLLTKESAEKLDVATLRELANNTGNKSSAEPVNGAPASATDTGGKMTIENMFKDYSYNDTLKESVN